MILNNSYKKIKNIGFKNVVVGGGERIRNQFLFIFFKFDKWHLSATYHLKPYKSQVVNILRNSDADVIIEIGCGMGDIISRVEISQRGIGIDLDQQIINCAKYLHGGKCSFYNADLVSSPELLSNLTSQKDKSMLVMINWLHNIEFSLLEKVVTELKRKANINYLLMDVIHENTKGYKYKHSQASSLGDVLLTEESIDKVRYFILIKLSG